MDSALLANDYRKWTKTYWVFAGYAAYCALLIILAPPQFSPHFPASAAYAEDSTFPATTAFSIEGMWLAFPAVLTLLAIATPIKIRSTHPDLFSTSLALVVFAGVVAPLLISCGTVFPAIHPDTVSKLGHLLDGASRNKFFLGLALCWYFIVTAFVSWIAYVALPRTLMRLIKQNGA